MKKIIIAATVAITALFVVTPDAEAGPKFKDSKKGSHDSAHRNASAHRNDRDQRHDQTPHIVRTVEINRSHKRIVSHYRSGGSPVYRHVTIVTYKQVYSNGHSRTYTKTLNS